MLRTTQYVLSLDEIIERCQEPVGGKARNCARLRRAGLPVPDGFVVTAPGPGVQPAAQEIGDALARFPPDARFAVRSSAVDEDSADHSFAGIHKTLLNVAPEDVPAAVKTCLDSVYAPEALAYRQAQGLPTENLSAAVLVQQMIDAQAAGVAFTADPVSGDADVLVINAAWGLGEAVVAGLVEPDEYRVQKDGARILGQTVGRKERQVILVDGMPRLVDTPLERRAAPVLNPEQIQALTGLLLRIQELYPTPQDVEWCYDGAQFWIVQSRPITTVRAAGPDIQWTRANLREVLPDLPAPQVVDSLVRVLEDVARYQYGGLLAPVEELGPMAKAFYGRPYFNLSQFLHLTAMLGQPPAVVLRGLGHGGALRPEDEIAPRVSWRTRLRTLPPLLRIIWRGLRLRQIMESQFQLCEELLARLNARDPATLPDETIWAELEQSARVAFENGWRALLLGSAISMQQRTVEEACARVGYPSETLLYTQLAAGEETVSSRQAFDLLDLAQIARREERTRRYFQQATDFRDYAAALDGTEFLARFQGFLEKYGHRANYETDWSLPRFAEDPSPLLFTIASHVAAETCPTSAEVRARREEEAAQVWQAFEARLSPRQRRFLLPRVRKALDRMKQLYAWRELNRSESVRVSAAMRRYTLVLARRFVERGWIETEQDYYFLLLDEIRPAIHNAGAGSDRFRSLVARRRAEQAAWSRLEMPLVMRESELPALIRQATRALPEAAIQRLEGQCISTGWAEGEVVVLHAPTEFARMKPGAILVAPATDPSWTPLFTLATGVIVEIGGVGSHASTVAREYGLPAVANVRDATRLLRTGDRVRLNANDGVVEVIGRQGDRETGRQGEGVKG